MILSKKNLLQMAVLVAVALVLGLGANFLSRNPLPLLRPLPKPADAVPAFGEVDADFVRQSRNAPNTLLLDARAKEAFGQGRIPGALSLPLGEFAESFAALEPRLRQASLLVVYCSGWTCNDSRDLAGLLWSKGLKSLLLYKGGMEDWNEKGYAVEK